MDKASVWQHVLPAERPRVLRKLLGLLRAGGMLALSLRHGPDEAAQGMHPVSLDEVERLARAHGAIFERAVDLPDQLGRPDVSWTGVVLRLPDDGTGAFPLLRHIILNDAKSSTYKLGLLRALCRVAGESAGSGGGLIVRGRTMTQYKEHIKNIDQPANPYHCLHDNRHSALQ